MNQSNLLEISTFSPNSLKTPNAWVGHLPFAAWIIKELSPNIFVELGSHTGNSYFAFCQAVAEYELQTKCFAVDTWKGDEHAGRYGDEVYRYVDAHNQECYSGFSNLLRMTFDDALSSFSDGSIELLHIDGLHTYEAVSHDFETWLPKLAPGAVVLFHDSSVRGRGFGVWKLWEELKLRYANNFEFVHSNGLGVLQLDGAIDNESLSFLWNDSKEKKRALDYFVSLGEQQLQRYELGIVKGQVTDCMEHIDGLNKSIAEYHDNSCLFKEELNGRDKEIHNLENVLTKLKAMLSSLECDLGGKDDEIEAIKLTIIRNEERIKYLGECKDAGEAHIASLDHRISDYHALVNNLTKTISKQEDIISFILSSRSWRLMRLWRVVGEKVKASHNMKYMRSRFQAVAHTLYHVMPLSASSKQRVKLFAFKAFPLFFQNTPSYVFWKIGEDRSCGVQSAGTVSLFEEFTLMLPSSGMSNNTSPRDEVDVIVPVYRGLEQTRRCLESVLKSKVNTPFRLIVINDASPDADVSDYVNGLVVSKQLIVVNNKCNLGFTATVNRGMGMSKRNDVVLLNADAEVANDWLDKIKAHAYSGGRVGTVTPFSNNATICNYPSLEGWCDLPPGETTESLDIAFSRANASRHIEIPTAVGFCMYIRRDCLSDIGLFDVDTFGKGYGEENDFCMRATSNNWKHLLAADTFVYHEGEVSFDSESDPRKEVASNIIRKLYPDYEPSVARHVGLNQAYPLRVAATASRFRMSDDPVVLHILHSHGGGTEKHVDELCRIYKGDSRFLIMTPLLNEVGGVHIYSPDPQDALSVKLPSSELEFLVPFFQSFGVSQIHVHHVLGYLFDLQRLIEGLKVPFYLTVHDYFLVCPRINLMTLKRRYCGEPEASGCNKCLSVDSPFGARDIVWWRERNAWLFNQALVVICPSVDVEKRCQNYFPSANYRVVGHEKMSGGESLNITVPDLRDGELMRIALLGVLAPHKGGELISEVLLKSKKNGSLFQFQLIGYAQTKIPNVSSTLFSQTGPYDDKDLAEKIDLFDPHLILFSSVCPETYSYTLSAALKSGRPIFAPNLGSFPERLAKRPWVWIEDWGMSASNLIQRLEEIRNDHLSIQVAPELPARDAPVSLGSLDRWAFYETEYFLNDNDPIEDVIDVRKSGMIAALVLLDSIGVEPSPCAYVRLILPLIQEKGQGLSIHWVCVDNVTSYKADVLICQRTVAPSVSAVDTIVNHCNVHNIPIVYDLDDLLTSLPNEHPEQLFYKSLSEAVHCWLRRSDEVWVSTPALKKCVSDLNRNVYVLPNYIDDQLWPHVTKPVIIESKSDAVVRILYMGTQSHLADFNLIKSALKKIGTEYCKQVEITLVGIVPDCENDGWFNIVSTPKDIGVGYPAFVNWINANNDFDIGIAPLIDNEFNRCKSEIKFYDYSVLGLVTVASDIGVYNSIRNGENGFLVGNTEDEWFEILKKLVVDACLVRNVGSVARNEVFEKHGVASVFGSRLERLNELLSRRDVD